MLHLVSPPDILKYFYFIYLFYSIPSLLVFILDFLLEMFYNVIYYNNNII